MPITEFKVQSPTTDQQMQAEKVGYLNQRCNPAVTLKNNNDTVSQTSPTDPRAPCRAILSVCSQELIDRGNEMCSCFAATSTAAPELTFSAGDQSKPPIHQPTTLAQTRMSLQSTFTRLAPMLSQSSNLNLEGPSLMFE